MGSLLKFLYIFSKLAIFPTKIDSKKSSIKFSAFSLRTTLSVCLVSMPYIGCLIWFFSSSSDCRTDFWEAFKKTYEKIDIAVMIVYPFSIMTPLCPILWIVMISKFIVSVPEFSLSSNFNFPKKWLQQLAILGLDDIKLPAYLCWYLPFCHGKYETPLIDDFGKSFHSSLHSLYIDFGLCLPQHIDNLFDLTNDVQKVKSSSTNFV